MQNLEVSTMITEGAATEAIFNACRANPGREPRGPVTFTLNADGTHEACLRNASGYVVALATVDKYDV